jgi:hypothetical protein
MIFQEIDMRLSSKLAEQRLFDLLSGHILHVQHSPLGVAAFAAKIKFAVTGNVPLIEV